MGSLVTCITNCGIYGTGACTSSCRLPTGAACIEPSEVCDGMSQDCDTFADEGAIVDRSATDYQVDTKTGEAWFVRACWNGAHYGVVWVEQSPDATSTRNEVWFAMMSSSGTRVGSSVLVDVTTTPTSAVPPNAAIACGTDRFGILVNKRDSTSSDITLYLRPYTGSFTTPITVSQSDSYSASSDITFDRSDLAWGVVWTVQAGNSVMFQPMTQAGSPGGGTLLNRNIAGALCSVPDQVRIVSENSGRFATVWSDFRGAATRGVVYQRIGTTAVAGLDLPVWSAAGSNAVFPEIAWSGVAGRHRIVWVADPTSGTSVPSLMNAEVTGVVTPSVTDAPAVLVSGTTAGTLARASIDWWAFYGTWLVAWYEATSGVLVKAYRLDSSGNPIESPIAVSDSGTPYHPEVVAGPDTDWAAVVWDDGRGSGGNFDPYMDFLGCF